MTDVPTITLPDNEPQVLTNLLDAAGRQLGLPSFAAADYFAKKIAEAQKAVTAGLPPADPDAAA